MHHWPRSHHQPHRHFRCLGVPATDQLGITGQSYIISRDIALHAEHKREDFRLLSPSEHQNISPSPAFKSTVHIQPPILQAFPPGAKTYKLLLCSRVSLSSQIDTISVTSLHPSLPTAIHVSASDPGLHRATMVLEN